MRKRLPIHAILLCAALLLAGCGLVVEEESAASEPEPTEEIAATPPAVTVRVTSNANVRTGPGTDHGIGYWLTVDTPVTVLGRNTDSTWLHIEHDGRPGWIFGALTDIDAEVLAALRDTAPADMAAVEPAEPAPPAVEEPTPESIAPAAPAEPTPVPTPVPEPTVDEAEAHPHPHPHTVATVTVTGSQVNLRRGPGTDHAIDGQVRAGDELRVTGRNADGTWLQVMHPVATGELVWIYGALTDIDAAIAETLADATTSTTTVSVPEPDEPTTPAATPAPVAYDDSIADCTQWHTVNPNETRLEQITDWFGLDLQLVETINRVSNTEQLIPGMQLCLKTSHIDTVLTQVTHATDVTVDEQQPAVTPAPQVHTPPPAPAPPAGCPACPFLPDFPEHGHPNAPIGQKVVDSPLGVLWHAPGSFSRDLPGLDYDFELRFTDNSVMWDWSVRDFQACYDAVRVHMGEVASEVNLQRLEVRLSDPAYPQHSRGFVPDGDYGNWYQSPWANLSGLPDWPNWDPATLPHPDLGLVTMYCDYSPPTGQIFCDIYLDWGNSHSIHLNAAATLALANSIAVASDNAREYRHNRLDQRTIDFNAYLFPILDNRRGDPAGQGPCLDVARAR